MSDSFEPKSLTIKQLLTDAYALYQIPVYQRPYKWGDDEIDKLWADIVEIYKNEEPNYFLGSIITAPPEKNARYLDVVDGQQRLTTLIILMATIRDLYPNINAEQCKKDPSAVGLEQLKSAIMVSENFKRLRLETHPQHSLDFQQYIINGDTRVLRKPLKKDLRKDEAPEYKFINTSVEFSKRLQELETTPDGVQCGPLLNYIFNQIKIIRIDCTRVSFAIKLFQVLNARGLDLTNADLIKSFLINKLQERCENKDIEREQEKFLHAWSACEKIAVDSDESINELFVMYEYFLLASNPKKSLYDELAAQFEDTDPLEVISDFKNFISLYYENLYSSEDPIDYSFFYLRWSVYWKAIVITALHSSYPDTKALKIAIRRYFYLFWIAGFTLSRIKQSSFNIIKWIKDKKPINEIKQDLQKLINTNSVQKRVRDALEDNVYSEAWCKPLLALIEYNQIDRPERIRMGDKRIHVEHVLPQDFNKVYGWKHIIEDVRDGKEWVHKLGNLTLLSGRKNIKASNDAFKKKVLIYQGKGMHGADEDRVTSFRITQKIFDDYNQKKITGWDFNSINARKQFLLENIEKILDIDLKEIK